MEPLPCLSVGEDTQKEGEWGGQVPQAADKGISGEGMIQDAEGLPQLRSGACPGAPSTRCPARERGRGTSSMGLCLWLLHPLLLHTCSEELPDPQVMSLVVYPLQLELLEFYWYRTLP